MLDFSFTQDPVWRSKRLALWEKKSADLKGDYNRKQLDVLGSYFLDGVEGEYKDFKVDRIGLIFNCPKIDREAWIYFLSQRYPASYNESRNFTQVNHWQHFVDCVVNKTNSAYLPTGWTQENYLDLFDFVLGKTFSPVVKSQFPIGKNQVIGVATINGESLFSSIMRAYSPWFRKDGREPFLWLNNPAYFRTLVEQLPVNPVQKALDDMDGVSEESDLDAGVKFMKKFIAFHKGLKPISGNEEDIAQKTQALNNVLAVFQETEPFEGAYDKLYGLVE